MHKEKSKQMNGEAFLSPKASLSKQLAISKSDVERIKLDSCDADDEWIFKACSSPLTRFKWLAISNKHAGILGMPWGSLEDAE